MEVLTNPHPLPTEVGQIVRTFCRGGEVTSLMDLGEVVRFNRNGFPVVRLVKSTYYGDDKLVTDRYGCFRVVPATTEEVIAEAREVGANFRGLSPFGNK